MPEILIFLVNQLPLVDGPPNMTDTMSVGRHAPFSGSEVADDAQDGRGTGGVGAGIWGVTCVTVLGARMGLCLVAESSVDDVCGGTYGVLRVATFCGTVPRCAGGRSVAGLGARAGARAGAGFGAGGNGATEAAFLVAVTNLCPITGSV